ncbi:MAG: DUF1016 family protein [Muribaculaceae bacterium]|nr:DUF1016 family protein [Muribaculaceae bacterium]
MQDNAIIVSSHNVKCDQEYYTWLRELKTTYHNAQERAAVKVNSESLLWKWRLGRDLVMRKAEQRWGAGVVEQLSLDLKAEFPNEKGFGVANLWFMKKWYLFYSEKLHQAGRELQLIDTKAKEKLYQAGREIKDIVLHEEIEAGAMSFPEVFAYIPWRHHVEIINKCKSVEEALFYIYHSIEEGWSRSNLINCIKANLYKNQGFAITNFAEQLPHPHAEMVQEITKENYDFGFVTLPRKYDELQLEDALSHYITRFLLELGNGFSFVGRQKEIIVDGVSRRIDMLFYHLRLHCYVVVELKTCKFSPEYAGKLNFYVNAVDDLLKTEEDNPTIGLLICSDMRQTEVKYSFMGINTPIGVAKYSNVQVEELQAQLPSIEQLQQRIMLLEQELQHK